MTPPTPTLPPVRVTEHAGRRAFSVTQTKKGKVAAVAAMTGLAIAPACSGDDDADTTGASDPDTAASGTIHGDTTIERSPTTSTTAWPTSTQPGDARCTPGSAEFTADIRLRATSIPDTTPPFLLERDGFRVQFPNADEPAVSRLRDPFLTGGAISTTIYSQTIGLDEFTFAWTEYRSRPADVERSLRDARRESARTMDGETVASAHVELDGVPGLCYEVVFPRDDPGGVVTGLVYQDGAIQYHLLVHAPAGRHPTIDPVISDFFDSFEITG